jgi:hypothetical protein
MKVTVSGIGWPVMTTDMPAGGKFMVPGMGYIEVEKNGWRLARTDGTTMIRHEGPFGDASKHSIELHGEAFPTSPPDAPAKQKKEKVTKRTAEEAAIDVEPTAEPVKKKPKVYTEEEKEEIKKKKAVNKAKKDLAALIAEAAAAGK